MFVAMQSSKRSKYILKLEKKLYAYLLPVFISTIYLAIFISLKNKFYF